MRCRSIFAPFRRSKFYDPVSSHRTPEEQAAIGAKQPVNSNHGGPQTASVALHPKQAALYMRLALGLGAPRQWRLWPLKLWITRDWSVRPAGPNLISAPVWKAEFRHHGSVADIEGSELRWVLRSAWASWRKLAQPQWGPIVLAALVGLLCLVNAVTTASPFYAAFDLSLAVWNASTIRRALA